MDYYFCIDGFALQFTAVLVIARDENWPPTQGELYAVFLCTVLLHDFLATVGARIMGRLQNVFVIMNLVLIIGTIIALPVGVGADNRNDAQFVFGQTQVS